MSTVPQTMTYQCPHCHQAVEVDPLAKNEVLRCPNEACGRPFQIAVPVAKPLPGVAPTVPRPAVVEAGVEEPPAPETPPVAAPLRDVEDEVARFRLNIVRRYPVRCGLYAVAVSAALVTAAYLISYDWVWTAAALAVVAGFFVWRFAAWYLRMKAVTIVLTTKRCVVESGVVSKETLDVQLKNVAEVNVEQGVVSRWLDVGDVAVFTKDGSPKLLYLMAVPRPERVAELLRGEPPNGQTK